MEPRDYLAHPAIEKFVKRIPSGQYLFNQGEMATTMIVIIQGQVQLIGEKDGERHVESVLEAGSFLGEKIIMGGKPYQRAFSAKAETDTLCLALTARDLEQIQQTAPEILTDLLKRVISGVAVRFDRANYLIRALRSSNPIQRLLHCILYFSRSSGRKFPGGIQIILSADSLHYYVDMEIRTIAKVLQDLVDQKLLLKDGDDRYLIPSEQALIAFISNYSSQRDAA